MPDCSWCGAMVYSIGLRKQNYASEFRVFFPDVANRNFILWPRFFLERTLLTTNKMMRPHLPFSADTS